MEVVSRILSLRLQRKTHENEIVERYISYQGKKHFLTDEEYNQLLITIPSIWNTEKDQLTYFALERNKSFICTRVKDVYNYSIRETEKKTYNFDGVTEEQLDSFVSLLTDFYTKASLKSVNDIFDNVLSKMYDMSYLKYSLLETRDKSLKETDYMFNTDYSFKTDGEKILWEKYRQDWRDITEQQAWKESDYISVKIPVSPKPRDQLRSLAENIGSYIARVEIPTDTKEEIYSDFENNFVNLVENYSGIIVKIELIKRLWGLNLPLGFSASDIASLPNFITIDDDKNIKEEYSGNPSEYYDAYNKLISDKIKVIDDNLKKYDFNFTVGDILEKHLSDIKEKAYINDKNEEAAIMLEDLNYEENGL